MCEAGLCVANCSCRGCATGLTCGTDGRCIDTACATKSCAAGLICKLGDCVDPCANVTCPGNGTCSMGTCSTPMPGTGSGASSGQSNVNFGGSGTIDFGGGPPTSGGDTGSAGRRGGASGTPKGCGCRAAGGADAHGMKLWWLSVGLGLAVGLRRRRAASNARA